jgi:hypothetical protein
MTFLSKVEQAYLQGTREFTKTHQRFIGYRINKKLRLPGEEFQQLGIPDDIQTSSRIREDPLLQIRNYEESRDAAAAFATVSIA